jgi:hypothetical protein
MTPLFRTPFFTAVHSIVAHASACSVDTRVDAREVARDLREKCVVHQASTRVSTRHAEACATGER